ncbi:MAG: hypothetical protein IJX16_00795 [Clostridia bacterium]|nr:hypothetical protein [Clostridia bacterium]
MEKRFQFRKDLITAHFPLDLSNEPIRDDELSLENGVKILGERSAVITHAIGDFNDFLKTSLNVKANDKAVNITLKITKDGLEDVCDYKGRIIDVTKDGISIRAFDERGVAQALYDLEDMMTARKAPFVKFGKYKNKPLFSPRMAHSAYDVDVFPDGYLQNLAREGIDAILVFTRGVNVPGNPAIKNFDYNDLIDRAESYGIDVYAYSYLKNFNSPTGENAEKIYENIYGPVFKEHSKLKGIVFVGESVQFPSKDERTTGRTHQEFLNEDNLPDPKPAPGWWPCNDFPEWINLVKKVIYKYKPDADIVFWTYNWGWAPEKERIELINKLPTDISLLVTFEMFQNLPTKYGITERVCDYSVAFEGPGDYFLSEAKAAKSRGIRLYTQANAGGRTWDFGCMAYEPFPQQWMRRYQAMRECNEKYNLTGVMECHHFGFWPSFITKIEKKAFEYYSDSPEKILNDVVAEFSEGETERCLEALNYWSEAIRLYMPTDDEQYCAMRIGPAYPLALGIFPRAPKSLMEEEVMFGGGINEEYHMQSGRKSAEGLFTLHSVRMRVEMKILADAIKLVKKGINILKSLKNKNKQIKRLINMGEYMVACFTTDINVKKMYIYRQRLFIASSNKEVKSIIDGIRKLGAKEIKNSEKALKIVDKDSSLGYEPSMGYGGDRAHIEWKIRQVKHMMTYELGIYENGLKF